MSNRTRPRTPRLFVEQPLGRAIRRAIRPARPARACSAYTLEIAIGQAARNQLERLRRESTANTEAGHAPA